MPGLRVSIDSENPISVAMCDRCKFQWNRTALQFQWDWRGNVLTNLNILVCPLCLDVPQEQLRNPQLSADPIPVRNPRPDIQADSDYISTENLDFLMTEGDDFIKTEQ